MPFPKHQTQPKQSPWAMVYNFDTENQSLSQCMLYTFQIFMEFQHEICALNPTNMILRASYECSFLSFITSYSSRVLFFRWNETFNRNNFEEKRNPDGSSSLAPVLHLSRTFQTFWLHFDEYTDGERQKQKTKCMQTHSHLRSHVCVCVSDCLLALSTVPVYCCIVWVSFIEKNKETKRKKKGKKTQNPEQTEKDRRKERRNKNRKVNEDDKNRKALREFCVATGNVVEMNQMNDCVRDIYIRMISLRGKML